MLNFLLGNLKYKAVWGMVYFSEMRFVEISRWYIFQ